MVLGGFLSCWYGSALPKPRNLNSIRGRFIHSAKDLFKNTGAFIHEWTPFLLVASYFVFSTCMYTFCTEQLISIFWFLYLTTNFYIAGSTVLEAVMSLTPTRDARKAVRKVQDNDWVFPTPDDALLFLDLVIVRNREVVYHNKSKSSNIHRSHIFPMNRTSSWIVSTTPWTRSNIRLTDFE